MDVEGNIVEYCYDDEIEDFNDTEVGFYGGPGEYFVEGEDSDELVDVNTGDIIEKEECDLFEVEKEDEELVTQDELMEEGEINDISVDRRKNSVTIKFPDSTKINNKKYIGTTDKYQKALVNNFKTLLGDDGKGTTYSDLKSGVNKYLSSVGKGKNFIKVNNGWFKNKSSSIVYVNYGYVDGVGYIK